MTDKVCLDDPLIKQKQHPHIVPCMKLSLQIADMVYSELVWLQYNIFIERTIENTRIYCNCAQHTAIH